MPPLYGPVGDLSMVDCVKITMDKSTERHYCRAMERQRFSLDTAMDLVIDADDADHTCPEHADCEICMDRAIDDSFLLDAPWGGGQ